MKFYESMKSFATKMEKIFFSKGCIKDKSYPDTEDDGMAGMTGAPSCRKKSGSTAKRKLPVVPKPKTASQQRLFTPTYRFAVNWLNKNHGTLDIALDLLDVHPKLIEHEHCTKLRDYISKAGNNNNSDLDEMFNWSARSAHPDPSRLPEILVSHVPDDLDKARGDSQTVTHRIRLCGDVEAEKWQRLVINLCCKYSITCATPTVDNIASYRDVDLFIFLVDSRSFSNETCRLALREAYIANCSVLFVRDMEFELCGYSLSTPSSPSIHESRVYPKFDTRSESPNSVTCSSPCFLTTSLPMHTEHAGSLRTFRSFSRSVDSGLGRHSAMSSNPGSPCKSPKLSDQTLPSCLSGHRHLTDDDHVNITNVIKAEYGMALTYHPMYHDTCCKRICTVIESRLQNAGRSRSLAFHSPASNICSSMGTDTGSMVGKIYSVKNNRDEDKIIEQEQEMQTKRRKSVTFIDDIPISIRKGSIASETSITIIEDNTISRRRRKSSISAETVFLLSNPQRSNTPIVVRWPKETAYSDSISSSPSIDSFGFQEVDLSKRLNELDLFGAESEYSE